LQGKGPDLLVVENLHRDAIPIGAAFLEVHPC
jgi:hypothetical protein